MPAKETRKDITSIASSKEECLGNTGSGFSKKSQVFCDKPELTALSWAERAKRLYGFLPA